MEDKRERSLLFLVGLVGLYFSNGRMAIEVMGFIAPVFLVLAGRKLKASHMKVISIYLLYSIGMGVVFLLSFWKFSSTNVKDPLFLIPFLLGFLMSIPYIADAIFHQNKKGLLADLVFPLTYVTVEYLYVSLSPMGSTGSIAYAQDGFLILLQLLSVTGIYGITFIVSWFASSAATIIEDKFKSKCSLQAMISYGVVFLTVMLFGVLRLGGSEENETIKVSGISAYDLRCQETKALWHQALQRTEAFEIFSDEIYNHLEQLTRKEAEQGSKVVVWSELSPWATDDTIDQYKEKMSALAKETGLYLVVSPYVFPGKEGAKGLNEAMLILPDGKFAINHIKYGGAIFDNIIEGNKRLQGLDTEYGRMGVAICWDADFPAIMRQAGRLGIDLLFSPAADWEEITPLHSRNLYYRGIENGMSVIRETASGQSLISDAKGRMIEEASSFDTPEASEWIIRGEMPTKGCQTIYLHIGDVFAYLCILGLLVLIGWEVRGQLIGKFK